MSLKPKPPHPLGNCPGCAEPLESGDRFCGACGFDLSAAEVPDRPTVPIALPVEWPEPPPRDPQSLTTATQHPHDLPGTDSGGRDLPTIPVRTDGVPEGAGAEAAAAAAAAAPQGDAAEAVGATGGQAPAERTAPGAEPEGAGAPGEPVTAERTPAVTGPEGATSSSGSGPEAVQPSDDGDFTLPAPDPRAALRAEPTAAPPTPAAEPSGGDGRKVCVACRVGRVDGDGYCEHCGHAQPRDRDHMEEDLPAVAAVSDRGLRHHRNEDSFAVASTALADGSPATLAVVCDGVSSATRPDEASAAAASAARAALLTALPRGTHPQQAMQEAIVAAADAVTALAERPEGEREHQNAPACTIVGSIVTDGLLVVGWVGDSRAYWVPDDRTTPPARLTEDDSWAAQMVAAGLMNEAQAYADERAHAITGWLGADSYELDPHTAAFKPDRPGVVVVCTDGLWNYAEAADDMARVLPPDAAERPLHAAQVLVGHALDGGGHDNITVALLPFALPSPGAADPA
ncbi:PP2C family protein-serine/threonine phosphatase [Streptomyces roseicoloratus]|uniref:PP2C family protein-serine/threonine phosphatase n=1 Tax=Streptomyces roseicoloratus TaxID=2508722 RepID=UPI001009D351|nr:PP2C family serine/threonine-protein phosphatase [Streptomyces roseicoloratus]